MARFVIKRLLQMALIVFLASILIFAMVRVTPSDPIASMTKGKRISQETREALVKQYHLDKTVPEQYVIWITGALRGDLGNRLRHQLRIIPELKFFLDDSLDYVENIDKLLKG